MCTHGQKCYHFVIKEPLYHRIRAGRERTARREKTGNPQRTRRYRRQNSWRRGGEVRVTAVIKRSE